ncbi:MAG: hypothetical protein ACLQDV_16575 [Candidatus Binataceae bacterium]
MKWIAAPQLEIWAGSEPARAKLPALVAELVRARGRIRTMRFPSEGKSQVHGFDGHLVAEGVDFVQDGESFWELSTRQDYVTKANSDIKERSEQTPAEKRAETSFVYATPRTWNKSGENELQKWREKKREEFGWKEVVVIDGAMFEDWLGLCPPVAARWARYELGLSPRVGARSVAEFWSEYTSRFKVSLTEPVLLCQREPASSQVLKHLRSGPGPLVLRADSPDEAIAFAIATIRTADAETRQFLEARTIVVDSDDAAKELAEKKDLIFIPRGNVTNTGLLARIGPTLIGVGRDRPERESYVRLELPTAEAFGTALQTMGLPENEARLLARSCGRSATILARLFPNGDAADPKWVERGRGLIPALMAGAWDSKLDEDKKILCSLAATDTYEECEAPLREFQRMDDPPIDREGTVWKMRAPVDGFVHLAHLLGDDDFGRLKSAATEVFKEIDPSLTADAPPKAWEQPKPRHSSWLRDGLATTLLQIAVNHEGAALQLSHTTPEAFVNSLIKDLPGLSSDWRLMASLRAELPLLMEAAPRPFLSALEHLLQEDGSGLQHIFREGDFFSSVSPHTYVLWGLEALAWDPDYLLQVSVILAKLARIDPGGTLSNRPINTLLEIFRPWHPNTNASQKQRLTVLELVVREVPEIGWDFVRQLLPTTHGVGMYTAKPKYREAGGSDKEILTQGKVFEAYTAIVKIAFALAEKDPERWAYLVRDFANLSSALRSELTGLLAQYLETAAEKDRLQVWEAIRNTVNRHVAFKDAQWSLPPEELRPLSELVKRFGPADPVTKVTWLFDEHLPDIPDRGKDIQHAITDARRAAIDQLVNSSGVEAIIRLAEAAKIPNLVASALPPVLSDIAVPDQLFQLALTGETEKLREFAASLSGVAAVQFPDKWNEVFRKRLAQNQLSIDETVRLLQYWPDKRATWDFVSSLGKEQEDAYWSTKPGWPVGGELEDLVYAAERYMKAGRCITAIQSLGEKASTLPIDLIFRLLESSLDELNKNPNHATGMFTYYLEHILDALEKRGVETAEIARLEWAFFPLFEHGRRALRLHRVMAKDPAFYVSLLGAVFLAEGEKPSEPTPEERARATAAYRLLSSFGDLPGREGDNVNADQLSSWVSEVRRLGTDTGRRGMTNEFIGHVLAHAPEDPSDKAWPHRVVRDIIETLSSEETERGILVERFNVRGVHSKELFEGGKQERGFAEQALGWAAKCSDWPRTQNLLKDIAHDWNRHAEWEDAEARKDRMRN